MFSQSPNADKEPKRPSRVAALRSKQKTKDMLNQVETEVIENTSQEKGVNAKQPDKKSKKKRKTTPKQKSKKKRKISSRPEHKTKKKRKISNREEKKETHKVLMMNEKLNGDLATDDEYIFKLGVSAIREVNAKLDAEIRRLLSKIERMEIEHQEKIEELQNDNEIEELQNEMEKLQQASQYEKAKLQDEKAKLQDDNVNMRKELLFNAILEARHEENNSEEEREIEGCSKLDAILEMDQHQKTNGKEGAAAWEEEKKIFEEDRKSLIDEIASQAQLTSKMENEINQLNLQLIKLKEEKQALKQQSLEEISQLTNQIKLGNEELQKNNSQLYKMNEINKSMKEDITRLEQEKSAKNDEYISLEREKIKQKKEIENITLQFKNQMTFRNNELQEKVKKNEELCDQISILQIKTIPHLNNEILQQNQVIENINVDNIRLRRMMIVQQEESEKNILNFEKQIRSKDLQLIEMRAITEDNNNYITKLEQQAKLQNEALQKNNNEFSDLKQQSLKEISQLNNQISLGNEVLQKNTLQLHKMNEINKSMKENISRLEQEKSAKNEYISTLEREKIEQKKEIENITLQFKNQMTFMDKEFQEKLKKNEGIILSKDESINKLERENIALRQDNKDMISNLGIQKENLEKTIFEFNQQIKFKDAILVKYDSQLLEMSVITQNMSDYISKLNQEAKDRIFELNKQKSLNENLEKKNNELSELNKKNEETVISRDEHIFRLNRESITLKQEINFFKEKISELSREKEQIEKTIFSLNEGIKLQDATFQNYISKLQKYDSQLLNYEKTNNELSEQNKKNEKVMTSMYETIFRLKGKKKALKQENLKQVIDHSKNTIQLNTQIEFLNNDWQKKQDVLIELNKKMKEDLSKLEHENKVLKEQMDRSEKMIKITDANEIIEQSTEVTKNIEIDKEAIEREIEETSDVINTLPNSFSTTMEMQIPSLVNNQDPKSPIISKKTPDIQQPIIFKRLSGYEKVPAGMRAGQVLISAYSYMKQQNHKYKDSNEIVTAEDKKNYSEFRPDGIYVKGRKINPDRGLDTDCETTSNKMNKQNPSPDSFAGNPNTYFAANKPNLVPLMNQNQLNQNSSHPINSQQQLPNNSQQQLPNNSQQQLPNNPQQLLSINSQQLLQINSQQLLPNNSQQLLSINSQQLLQINSQQESPINSQQQPPINSQQQLYLQQQQRLYLQQQQQQLYLQQQQWLNKQQTQIIQNPLYYKKY